MENLRDVNSYVAPALTSINCAVEAGFSLSCETNGSEVPDFTNQNTL